MSLHLLTIHRQHLKVDCVIVGYGADLKLTNCKAHKENKSLSWQRISCLWTKEDESATEEKRISRDERELTAHDKERVHSQKRWITSYGPSLPFTNIVKGSTSHRLLHDHYPAMNFTDQVVLYMLCLVVGRMNFSTLILLSSFIERYTIYGTVIPRQRETQLSLLHETLRNYVWRIKTPHHVLWECFKICLRVANFADRLAIKNSSCRVNFKFMFSQNTLLSLSSQTRHWNTRSLKIELVWYLLLYPLRWLRLLYIEQEHF